MIRSQKTKPMYLPTPNETTARSNSTAILKFLFFNIIGVHKHSGYKLLIFIYHFYVYAKLIQYQLLQNHQT